MYMRNVLVLFVLSGGAALRGQTEFHIYEGHGIQLSPWVRYNKADGLLAGMVVRWEITDPDFYLTGRGGYAFGGKYGRYAAGITKVFPSGNNEFSLDAEYHDLTETSDRRILSDFQNSLGAVLFKADFFNYYRATGGQFRAGHNWGDVVKVTAVAAFDRYRSLKNSVKASLFDWGGDGTEKRFEQSPAVAEGDDRWLGMEFHYDPRPSKLAPVAAWTADVRYANAAVLNGDFSYQRVAVDLKRYQTLPGRTYGVVAVYAASYDGKTTFADGTGAEVPADQFLYDLGGLGSLRGYDYREFRDGNRLVMAQIDFFGNGALLPRTPLKRWWGEGWIFKNFDLTVFADAGAVWTRSEKKSLVDFTGLKSRLIRADAGAGLAMKNIVRFDFAWVLKTGAVSDRGDFEFTFRLVYDL
jgi:outer membrane protein assembly factor BamA